MLGHISLGVDDLSRSVKFYDAVLGPLGVTRVWSSAGAAGYGLGDHNDKLALFEHPGRARAPGPGFHLAFDAPHRLAVDAFHAAAIENGGADAGSPGARHHYSPTYYAAFVSDPDGYKIEAVHQ